MRPGAGSLLESVIRLHGDGRRRTETGIYPGPNQQMATTSSPPPPPPARFAAYLALLHARPHRISPRLVFLSQQLEVLVFLLGVLVVVLVRLDAPAASGRVAVAEHVEAAVQIVRTCRPVEQIQQRVGVTKGKVQIAHIYSPRPLFVGKVPAQIVGVCESEAVLR